MNRFSRLFNYLSIVCIIAFNSGCALMIPTAIVGTTGMIATDSRSSGNIVDDALIVSKIKVKFGEKDLNNLLTKTSINSYEGRVMLTGTVKNLDVKKEAEKWAWSVEKVKEVVNEIKVNENGPKNKLTDTAISAKFKSKLILEKGVKSSNYVYDVNDGIMYIMGVAQNETEKKKVIKLAKHTSGVEGVVSHVIMSDDIRRSK
jgi:osmotically-inducible protein OsmY